MTPTAISANMSVLRELAKTLAGAELQNGDAQAVKTVVEGSLLLVEGALLDLNRIATALEWLASSQDIIKERGA